MYECFLNVRLCYLNNATSFVCEEKKFYLLIIVFWDFYPNIRFIFLKVTGRRGSLGPSSSSGHDRDSPQIREVKERSQGQAVWGDWRESLLRPAATYPAHAAQLPTRAALEMGSNLHPVAPGASVSKGSQICPTTHHHFLPSSLQSRAFMRSKTRLQEPAAGTSVVPFSPAGAPFSSWK